MVVFRTVILALLATFLASCQPQLDARYRYDGAGADLYSAEAVEGAANLRAYFNTLCDRADIAVSGVPLACNTSTLDEGQWRKLVYAGFNDIDFRCDGYINWLERKRSERFLTNQSLSALTGALGGLSAATGAAEAIGYVALALGFGTNVYNAYSDSLLTGIDISTIKTIIIERRLKFRQQFQTARFTSKPDAEFALRAYLRICTPASITMDVNAYSISAITGLPSLPQRHLEQQRQTLMSQSATPPVAVSPRSAIVPRQPPAISLSPTYSRFLENPNSSALGLGMSYMNGVFGALCVAPKEINDVDASLTDARIKVYQLWSRTHLPGASTNPITGRLTDSDVGRLAGLNKNCEQSKFKNIYEENLFAGSDLKTGRLLDAMLKVVPLAPLEKKPTTVLEMRGRIAAVRQALDDKLIIKRTDADLSDQLSDDLVNVLLGRPASSSGADGVSGNPGANPGTSTSGSNGAVPAPRGTATNNATEEKPVIVPSTPAPTADKK